MVASRRAAVACFAAAAFALAACDALLGLGQYKDVACAFDCGTDAREGAAASPEAGDEPDASSPGDAGPDGDGSSGFGDVVVPEGGWPVPTGHEIWAHWPMPNPDAAIAPDSATLLPNPMTYDAGIDGSDGIVFDVVTQLYWLRQSAPATDYDKAWKTCTSLNGVGWRVPTRIELVSLIDFTQPSPQPTIDPVVFSSVLPERYWTSSGVPGDGGVVGYWTVDFGTGLTSNSNSGSQVLCVNGGTP